MRFLLVEDEPEIAELVTRLLRREGYVLDVARSLGLAKEAVLSADYPLVILDRRLPDGDGTELVSFARSKGLTTRFLILSALGDVGDLVDGLDVGADDYIVKPFEPRELLARIRAALRRPMPETSKVWRCGRVAFDQHSRNVTVGDHDVALPKRELSILETLIRSAGRVVTRESILTTVYGYDDDIRSNTLESHLSRLRKQLARHEAGVTIHAVRGVGYMMKEGPCA